MRLILTSTILILILMSMEAHAQEITKLSDEEYTKTQPQTINIAQKQSECSAIEAQANALLARLAECKIEISTVTNSEIGKPVEVPDAQPVSASDLGENP